MQINSSAQFPQLSSFNNSVRRDTGPNNIVSPSSTSDADRVENLGTSVVGNRPTSDRSPAPHASWGLVGRWAARLIGDMLAAEGVSAGAQGLGQLGRSLANGANQAIGNHMARLRSAMTGK